MSERIIFFAHSGVRVRPARHTEQPRRDAVRPSALKTPAEILAGAAYSQRSSSNAKSLWCAVSANSPKIMAAIQMDFVPDGFRSSSPTTPTTQSRANPVSCGLLKSPLCSGTWGGRKRHFRSLLRVRADCGGKMPPGSLARAKQPAASWQRRKWRRSGCRIALPET